MCCWPVYSAPDCEAKGQLRMDVINAESIFPKTSEAPAACVVERSLWLGLETRCSGLGLLGSGWRVDEPQFAKRESVTRRTMSAVTAKSHLAREAWSCSNYFQPVWLDLLARGRRSPWAKRPAESRTDWRLYGLQDKLLVGRDYQGRRWWTGKPGSCSGPREFRGPPGWPWGAPRLQRRQHYLLAVKSSITDYDCVVKLQVWSLAFLLL